MTAKMLLEQYMAERHALGFVSKTDEGCIRRFLRDYKEPEDGKIVFSKEYVLEHIGTGLNQKANTVLRDVSAINGFLNLVQANVNTIYIKDYLGHADISTTEVYARADNEAKRAALEKASLCLELPCASNWEQDADLIAWLSSLG